MFMVHSATCSAAMTVFHQTSPLITRRGMHDPWDEAEIACSLRLLNRRTDRAISSQPALPSLFYTSVASDSVNASSASTPRKCDSAWKKGSDSISVQSG